MELIKKYSQKGKEFKDNLQILLIYLKKLLQSTPLEILMMIMVMNKNFKILQNPFVEGKNKSNLTPVFKELFL